MKLTCDSICKLKDYVKVSYYHYNLWRKKEKKRGRKQSRQRIQKKKQTNKKQQQQKKHGDAVGQDGFKENKKVTKYCMSKNLFKKMIQNYLSTKKNLHSFFTYKM